MGRFATGVTVVTTAQRDHVHGMTANGVMSVSLDPPLVVVSLGASRMDELLPKTRRYGISVLGAEQEELAMHFAGRPVEDLAPRFTWWKELPFLEGALAHKDSMGNGSVIRPGEVQRMSAGTGVRHSEMNPSRKNAVHFLQIWIIPDRRGHQPGYEQIAFPEAVRRESARGVKLLKQSDFW